MNEQNHLQESPILDIHSEAIQTLINSRGWQKLSTYERIGAAYDFVRNELKFGYNASDDLPASAVLQDGYGQCNTKGSVLMTLLRALEIPCRFHGFTIDNQLQKGAIPHYLFFMAPKYILHSWVEVYFEDKWIDLEGFILDQPYLSSIQSLKSKPNAPFKGYGVATACLQKPAVEWKGDNTYIQKEGIHDDFGVFDTPDEFYKSHGTNLTGIKRWLYQIFIRHVMNWNLERLRNKAR